MLGRPLAEVAKLSEAEINVWAAFRERYGFPTDRITVGTAKAGAYVGATFGGKAKTPDLLAQFGAARTAKERNEVAAVKAWFRARAAKKDGD